MTASVPPDEGGRFPTKPVAPSAEQIVEHGASPSAAEPTAKLPPDAIVLRPPMPPVVRFRRGLIIGLSATASAGLCAVTYMALRPPSAAQPVRAEQASAPVHPGQTILDGPGSYDGLPKLIVPRDATPPAAHDAPSPTGIAPPSSRDPEADQRHAAQTAPVLVTMAHGGSDATASPLPVADPPSVNATGSSDDPAEQKVNFAFASARGTVVDPHRLVPPAGGWLLTAGSIISASLITGVDSDLPGEIVAQVTDRVFDSVTGNILLIPQGARLIGRSDNRVSYGQNRALIAWQRLILPDGSSIELDSLPAGDAAGFTGLTDSVDRHEGRLVKGVALSSLLDVGSELSIGSGSGSLARALRRSVQQTGSDVAGQFASRNLAVQPTIRVRPGWPVTVVVREDLLLKPWKG
jgi:type IV secretion system protein TrbI